MTSKVSICNTALINLGADTIISLTEDTKQARDCNVVYDVIRQDLLRGHPWNFAIKRQQLAATVADPVFEFNNQFNLPSDSLRILKVFDETSEYKIEGDKIISDQTPLKVVYIRNEEDVALFDSNFSYLLSLGIAAEIAYSITGSTQQASLMRQRYIQARRESKQWDGQEGSPGTWEDGTWINEFFRGL